MEANESRDEHIDAIRRRFGITLTAVSVYNRLHREEIKNSGEIFNGRKKKKKTQALLYMMSSPDDTRFNSAAPLITQYGTMLVAALVYNPNFYAMAENYRGAVNAGFAVAGTGEDPHHTENKSNIIYFPRDSRVAFAAVAVFAMIFFITLFIKSNGTGQRINNDWIAGLAAPQRPDGVSFISDGSEGVRIGIKSPLMGTAMATDTKNADFAGTAAYYTRAIRAKKNNAALYVNRGAADTLEGSVDSALKDVNKAVELDPDNTSARFNRAVAYTGKGDAEIEFAIADLLHIIVINPGDSETYYALGALYIRQYELDSAKPRGLLEKALETYSHIQGYKDADIIFDIYSRFL
jgi:hypothetical protein